MCFPAGPHTYADGQDSKANAPQGTEYRDYVQTPSHQQRRSKKDQGHELMPPQGVMSQKPLIVIPATQSGGEKA